MPGKWISWGGWAVGVSGNMRTLNILEANAKRLFDDLGSAFEFTERLRGVMADHGYELPPETDDVAPSTKQEIALANNKSIWSICPALSVFEEGEFYAAGSGAQFGFGAAFAMPSNTSAEQMVRTAINAACEFDIYSSGGPYLIDMSEE